MQQTEANHKAGMEKMEAEIKKNQTVFLEEMKEKIETNREEVS
jgi:hypothetical protein